jgi:hypothetical protein
MILVQVFDWKRRHIAIVKLEPIPGIQVANNAIIVSAVHCFTAVYNNTSQLVPINTTKSKGNTQLFSSRTRILA